MNQNKLSTKRIRVVVAIISVTIIWWLHMLYALPGSDGSNMSCDAINGYAVDIDTEFVTDWHSALFGWEGIILKKIASFCGVSLCGIECINIMAFFIITLACLAVLYLILITKKWWVAIMIPIAFFYIVRCNGGHATWRLDHFFVYLLILLIATISALYRSKNNWMKILLVIAIVLLLWHCCAYRKNSIILVPVVMGGMLFCLRKEISFDRYKYILYLLFWSGCFGGFLLFANYIIPSVKTNPVSCMLISDVRIAHVLRGEQDSFFEKNVKVTRCKEADYKIGGYWHALHDRKNCSICMANRKNIFHSDSPYGVYVENLRKMPKEMIVAKVIQIMQLYRLDKFPISLQTLVEKWYPCVRYDKRVFFPHPSPKREAVKVWMVFFCLMITTYYSIKKIVKNRTVKNEDFDLLHVLVSCIALFYAASFIIVTPTPDYRYLMPSLSLGQLILLTWVCSYFGKVYRNIVTKYRKRKNPCIAAPKESACH